MASEFILVAATLMKIKAKTLLPRKEIDAQGNEIDPRQELVSRLLEYKRFKEVVELLKRMEEERGSRNERRNLTSEIKNIINTVSTNGEAELENVTLFKLMKVFKKTMDRYKYQSEIVQHKIVKYNYTMELQNYIFKNKKASFVELFKTCENKIHAVFNFLAILELVSQNIITISIGEGFNNFYLSV